MRRLLSGLLQETSGQDLAEYALLLVLVALAAAAALPELANAIAEAFEKTAQAFGAKETCCD